MNDMTVTWTVLARDNSYLNSRPLVIGITDAHSYDHAEMLFEEMDLGMTILGIYEGDLPWTIAMALYEKENN